ncbi:MAG TPA: HNH endonuclease signature motif containing protein [Patescibacteria group bacterium]|nr:HNH endonuclease signature motif containing protein [Patescibacteria group bacterium]
MIFIINPENWEERICIECGKSFMVRKCYTKRGQGKYCSVSCQRTYINKTNNPAWREEVRKKISKNHADVSGKNNPMYGRIGEEAPTYIDGRSKYKGRTYRKIALANNKERKCKCCGETNLKKLHVHHKDGNRSNNELDNLLFLCSKCHQTKAHIYMRDLKGRFVTSVLNKAI